MGSYLRRLCALALLAMLLLPRPDLHAAALPSRHPLAAAPLDVVINEIAWMGTTFDVNDEWVELYNNTAVPIVLSGWTLRAADGTPSITLTGTIPAYGYFLLERTDDTTIPDIPAEQVYAGALGNAGESLSLRDASNNVIDTANGDGGGWPAGDNTTKRTMERVDPLGTDTDANWGSNTTWIRNGHDNGGNLLNGTPKARNSLSWPDIALTKRGPPTAAVGAPLSYQIIVLNQGPVAAPGVLITDTLPAGFVYGAYDSPFPCTLAGSYLFTCQAGEIAAAGQAYVTITGSVALTASGTLHNEVYATTAVTEVTATNNLAWVDTLVQQDFPDLAAAKAGPVSAHTGDAISYTLAVSNVGALAAPGVRISDTMPAGVAFVAQSSPYSFTREGGRIVWTVGTLSSGAAARVTLTVQLQPTATGTLTNVVTAATTAPEPNISNNTAAWATVVLPPGTGHVVINEVAWAGTNAGHTADEWMELYNDSASDVDLTGWTLRAQDGSPAITLTGVVPVGGYYLLERGDDNTVIDIAADWVGSFGTGLGNGGEALFLRDAAGEIVDTANGDGGAWPPGDPNLYYQSMERVDPSVPDGDANWVLNDTVHRNGHAADWTPLNGTPKDLNSPRQVPDVGVAVSGPLSTHPGDAITYTLSISNTGRDQAPDVRLTDTLPAGVSFVSQDSPYSYTQQGRVVVWSLGTLTATGPAAITVTGQVEMDAPPSLHNAVFASTAAAEFFVANNTAAWDTDVVGAQTRIYLPLVQKDYWLQLLVGAVLYDGYQTSSNKEMDEAVRLCNAGTAPVDLAGWSLCKDAGGLQCFQLPAGVISPGEQVWVARDAVSFTLSFGFAPQFAAAAWFYGGNLSNTGDEVILRSPEQQIADVVVWGDSDYLGPGWSGAALQPYHGSGNFGAEGQVLHRRLDEATGRPVADSDTAADWYEYSDDPVYGRRPLYPGWDLEEFFWPLAVTEQASLTVAVAPDNAAEAFLAALGRAQQSIEAEFYELEHYDVVQALVSKAQQGVAVTLLLEGAPAGGMSDQERWACQQVEQAGGQCWFMFSNDAEHIHARYANLHAKVVLIDRQWAVISSQNPTAGGMPADDKADGTWGSRGVLLQTDAPGVVARLGSLFDADFDTAYHRDLARYGTYGYGPPPVGFEPITATGGVTYTVQVPTPLLTAGMAGFEVLSAPETALRTTDSLLGLLGRAGPGDQVDVQQMYEYPTWGQLSDGSAAPNLRLDAYIAAARRGAQVRILLNAGSFGADYLDISKNAEVLAAIGNLAFCEGLTRTLQVRLGNPTGYGIHNKMVLARVGGQGYAHIGSINGSETSSKVNREVAVQVRSDAVYDYLEGVFTWDWQQSGYLLVSEVLYNPAGDDNGQEWVEIFNPTDQPVDLSGWTIGDALEVGQYGAGRYRFPAATVIQPYQLLTIAQLAQMAGFHPDLEFVYPDTGLNDPSVPDMVPVASWEGFGFTLGNSGDRVLLLDPAGVAVDVVLYCGASVPCAISYPGVSPYPVDVAAGHSLERRPPERDTGVCGSDMEDAQFPTPGQFPAGYHGCR